MDARLGGPPSAPGQSRAASATAGGGDRYAMRLEQRFERLTSTLAAEADQRRRLEQRLDELATELAALRATSTRRRTPWPRTPSP